MAPFPLFLKLRVSKSYSLESMFLTTGLLLWRGLSTSSGE
jgi:hypothetical protein